MGKQGIISFTDKLLFELCLWIKPFNLKVLDGFEVFGIKQLGTDHGYA